MYLFLKLDYPLSGAIDIGILHSLYNQAKKVILYDKQYIYRTSVIMRLDTRVYTALHWIVSILMSD
jgi:hypothetical protein